MLLDKRTGQNRSLALFTMLVILCTTLLGLFPAGVWAETIIHQWVGGVDDKWNVAKNWDPEVVPSYGDTVKIPAGNTVTLTGYVTVCLQNEGTLILEPDSSLELVAGSELKGGAITGDGRLYIEDGLTTWSGGEITGTGGMVIQKDASLQVTSNSVLQRHLTNEGKVEIKANLELPEYYSGNGTLEIRGGCRLKFSASEGGIVGGAINDLGNAATLSVASGTDVTFSKEYNVANTHIESGATARWEALDSGPRTLELVTVNGGTATFAGDTSCELKLYSGTISGNGNLTLLNQSLWTSGGINGAGNLIVPSGATLTLNGSDPKDSERNLVLQGTLRCDIGSDSADYSPPSITGGITLSAVSSLHVELLDGYAPADGTVQTLINCAEEPLGEFSTATISNGAFDVSTQCAAGSGLQVFMHHDTTPPRITGHFPAHGAEAVEVTPTGTLTFTFDEPVSYTGKLISLYRVNGDITQVVATMDKVTGDDQYTITVPLPEKTLTYEQFYFVSVAAGAFQDVAGNLSAAYGGADHWQFTTEPIWASGYPKLSTEVNSGRLRPVVVINALQKAVKGYCVVVPPNGLGGPSSEQVRDGKDRDNVILPSNYVVELVIGKTNAAKGLDVPAQIVANRTLVPLRFVSESLGASVRWLSATRSVEIVMF